MRTVARNLNCYIVHFTMQGILTGIWPCGIIIIAAELFLSESKSQVYGCVHNFSQANPVETSGISKLIVIS